MSKKNKKKHAITVVDSEALDNQLNNDEIVEDDATIVDAEDNQESFVEPANATYDDEFINDEKVETATEEPTDSNSNDAIDEEPNIDEIPLDESDFPDYGSNEDEIIPVATEDESIPEEETVVDQMADLEVSDETNFVEAENQPLGDGTEPPVEEIHDHTAPKEKKPLTKKQKKIILISTLSAVLVIALVLGISLPIYFHFKDKIMINSQEDFTNVSKGTYFVLNKDITVDGNLDLSSSNYSIDLNKHTLTVNGDLIYATEDEKVINIGNTKKRNFIEGGTLIVTGSIKTNLPNANLNILSASSAEKADIVAKEVSISCLKTNQDINLTASVINLTGPVDANTANVNITSNSATISGNVLSALNATNSNLVIMPNCEVKQVILDATSNAQISGKITTSVSGGNKVAMLVGHSCGEFINIVNLALYRGNLGPYTMKDCKNVFYIDKLEAPADFIIEERANGKIFAVASKNKHASSFLFTINGTEYTSDSEVLDISDIMVKLGPTKHVITVTPKGNFNFDNFETSENKVLYIDADPASIEYSYKITLDNPSNLSVTKNEEGKVILAFNKVNFADGYEITINGTAINKDKTANPIESYDISEYITGVGTYSIRVKAYSNVKEINASKQSLTSYTSYAQLASVSGLNATVDKQDKVLKVSFEAPENAFSYIIYAQKADGSRVEIGRTTLTDFSVKDNAEYTQIVVVAEGYGFYEQSPETAAVDIIRE